MSADHVNVLPDIKLVRTGVGEGVGVAPGWPWADRWLIRFIDEGATYPNEDPMPAGLWDTAPPIGDDAWKKGQIGIESGDFKENHYSPTEKDQKSIRETFLKTDHRRDPGSKFKTYLLLHDDSVFAAINKRVIK